MASGFYKGLAKIMDFFGLGKTTKKLVDAEKGEGAYDKARDYFDNHSEEEIDKLMDSTPTGKAVKKTKTFADPFVDIGTGISDFAKDVKDNIEAETGKLQNDTNKDIAEQNLAFEREKFDYDKALQKQIFEREDTANQRTVNDMRMAGLNPINMQGTNGAGNVVSTSAPQNQFQMGQTNLMQILDTFFNASLQAKSVMSNNTLQQANANLLNQQAENQRIKNQYEESILASQIIGTRYDNQSKYWNNLNSKNNYLLNKAFGWTENMPDWMKQSSSRLGFRIFDDLLPLDKIEEALGDSYHSYSPKDMKNLYFFGNSNTSQQLLSDELLMGSLGIFGNILKLLTK